MSTDEIALGIGAIVVLGVLAQLLARRIGIPAILFLIVAGVLAGPVLDIIDPQAIFGDALYPVVNLGVGLLLFQGGMELDFRQLPGRTVLARLLTIGVLVTGILGTVACAVLLDLPLDQAAILGTVLIVSGPTVIIPLLDSARPKQPADGLLRAEGIFIDPIGAAIGYVTLQIVLAANGDGQGLLIINVVGIGTGLVVAGLLLLVLRNFLVPDEYEMALGVMCAVLAVTVADALASESGFFAATVLGVVLANQRRVSIAPILRFSSVLNVFVIGSLFVLLSAQVDLHAVEDVAGETLILVAILVLVVRPLAVVLSTTPSALTLRERAYLAAISPRGIVAAATSSLFALTLQKDGEPFTALVPVTFGVIFVTALIATVGAAPLARILGVRRPDPTGVVLVGWDRWMLDLARLLHDLHVPVQIVAPGAARVAEQHGPLPFPVIPDLPDRDDTEGLRNIAADLLVATDDLFFDRAIAAVGIEAIGRGHVHVVLVEEEGQEPGALSRTVRVPFAGPRLLEDLRTGGRVRILEAGVVPGVVTVLARVRHAQDGRRGHPVHVDFTPGRAPAREGESLIVQLRS